MNLIESGDRILFQGDSITDCGRDKSKDGGSGVDGGQHLGCGYAMLAAARLLADRPTDGLVVRNLGISGNRVVDLAARAQEHVWNLRPDVLSILIGVNDTWHAFNRQAGVDLPRYERTYRQLLADTRERLPGVRLVLCEPFVLPCGVVGPGWREDVDKRRAVVALLACEFSAVLVEFQKDFDVACGCAPPAYWAADGVHPTPAGHQLMADAWLAAAGHAKVGAG
jgi:lysophospholipase L1-like esterase